MHKLTALEVKNARPGDRLSDGGGLRLDVDRNGKAAWIFRFTSPVTGRERFMGMGSLVDVGLAKARDAAQEARALVRQNKDPIEQRRDRRAEAKAEESRGVSFKAYSEAYIAAHEPAWRNAKHRRDWRNSLATYAYPVLSDLPVADVSTEHVLAVLEPIWHKIPETASRVRGRIEAVLAAAKAKGLRVGENPALWRGHIDQMLPSKKKIRKVVHHAALPYQQMQKFWRALVADESVAARALQFAIATAARYGEVAQADWPEIDIAKKLWRVPAIRMKGDRDHVVPLSPIAIAALGEPGSGLIFPSPMTGRPLSDVALANVVRRHTSVEATTHGMRSSFRDWAGDETDHQRETIEAALAHAIGDETEAAYRRSTALAKRRALMDDWGKYCASRPRPEALNFAKR